MVRLILVRHGQTPSNVAGLLDSAAPGPGLTALGHEQAAALIERLAEEDVDRIVVSGLTRTRETAAPLAAALGLEPRVEPGLREVLAGDIELSTAREDHLTYLDTVYAWATGDLDAAMPGDPESGAAFFDRFDDAVAAATLGAGTVVCVSHGAAIRTWAGSRAVNLQAVHGMERGLPNTGIVVLEREDGPWRALSWEGARVESVDDDPTGAPAAP